MTTATKRLRRSGLAGLAALATVGGALVVTAGSAGATSTATVTRIAGTDRYDTAAQLATKTYPGGATNVIIASGAAAHFPDALSGNYLAGQLNAPILLTSSTDATLPKATMTALTTLHPTNVYILGDTNAVPAAQETALTTAGYVVKRLGGANRYATNLAILQAAGAAGSIGGTPTAIVASGANFPDALSAGSLAFADKLPIILTDPTSISSQVATAISTLGIKQVVIMGSTASVSAADETAINTDGATTLKRFAGTDRANTSQLLADWEIANVGFSSTTFTVATGDQTLGGADALAAGPFAGSTQSPVLVTDTIANPGAVTNFATTHATTETTVTILGTTNSVSAAAEAAITTAVKGAAGVSATTLPELVSASIVSTTTTTAATQSNPAGTVVSYTFDEPVVGADPTAFNVYAADDSESTAASTDLVSDSGNTVQVRFTGVNTSTLAGALTTATVVQGAVTDLQGQSNPEGAAGVGTASSTGSTALAAGVTKAPDVTKATVRNFTTTGGTASTAIDLTFDQAAFVQAAGPAVEVVMVDGTVDSTTFVLSNSSSTPGGGSVPGGSGTTTLTAVSPTNVSASQIARVIVPAGTAGDAATPNNVNPLEAVEVQNNGVTTTPDLLSAQFQPSTSGGNDTVVYTFDQSVTAGTVTDFRVYYTTGADNSVSTNNDAIAATPNPSNDRQLAVTFPNGTLTGAVGAQALTNAVVNGVDDERGVAGTSGTSGQAPKATAGPDLKSVAIVKGTDQFGNAVYTANYTFDEKVVPASITAAGFKLYLADGTELDGAGTPTVDTSATSTVVTVSAFNVEPAGTAATNAQIGAATLGTVVGDAIEDANTNPNPEGSAFTTGGTGTPAA